MSTILINANSMIPSEFAINEALAFAKDTDIHLIENENGSIDTFLSNAYAFIKTRNDDEKFVLWDATLSLADCNNDIAELVHSNKVYAFLTADSPNTYDFYVGLFPIDGRTFAEFVSQTTPPLHTTNTIVSVVPETLTIDIVRSYCNWLVETTRCIFEPYDERLIPAAHLIISTIPDGKVYHATFPTIDDFDIENLRLRPNLVNVNSKQHALWCVQLDYNSAAINSLLSFSAVFGGCTAHTNRIVTLNTIYTQYQAQINRQISSFISEAVAHYHA